MQARVFNRRENAKDEAVTPHRKKIIYVYI